MKRKFLLKFLGITFLTAILAVAAFCSAGYFRSAEAELPDVSYFSTERFQEPDGTVASVFASGDQYYNYLHDAKGRILVPDGEGYLRYAESVGGKPVATATRWNADEKSVLKTNTIFASDVDFEKHPELRNEFGALGASIDVSNLDRSAQNAYREGAAANAADETAEIPKIVNSVVFLRFPDESERIVTEGVLRSLSNIDGQDATLNDYFRSVSSETFGFYNVLPYLEDGSIFVYTAPNPISYYRSVPSSGLTRQREEGKLLGGALEAAKPYLEKGIADSGLKTDADNDGSVDSVTFLVLSDEPGSNAWNTLLWPHQWSFGSVFVTETLGNAKADRYLFMFTSSSRFFPVLTHEMGHVVGAPDLYHYSGSYDPVGYYDNMASSSGASPNLWLTATREKYLADAVGAHQVSEITENWDGYTLKATSSAAQKDLLAYKIRLNANASEWLYIEYRQPNAGRYDNNFDLRFSSAKSGLVVYRVKEGVYGNDAATAPGSGYYSSPDEIYVFRNSEISSAALKEPDAFIGSASNTTLYQDGNLYTTNGRNSGIVVTLKEIDAATATARFEVYHKDFPEYSGSEALVGLSSSKLAETEETLPQSAFYGQDFNFEIFPVYQKGKVKIIGDTPISTELFTVTGYDKFDKSFSAQRVSVSLDLEKAAKAGYAAAEGAVFPTLSFSVTVRDYDLNLEIISLTSKTFLVGTTDGFVADWKIVTAMGKTSATYNAASPETKLLRYEFLSEGEFTKTARVIFGELSAMIELNFYDKAVSMRYAGETSFLYGSEPLSFSFEISYLSGKNESIKVSAAEIGFSATDFGAQTLNYATENLETVFTVYVYKNVASYRLMKNGETALREEEINLRYAETIDFSAYVLSVRFEKESADTELPLEGRIPSKIYTYDEKVVVSFAEAYQNGKAVSVTFRVTVALKNDFELLSTTHKNVKIDYSNRLIVLKTAMDSAELSVSLKTAAYLSVNVKNANSDGVSVELVNRVNGAALSNFRFAVVLKGDANGDGIADADDVEALAELYLQDDSAYRNAVGDKNGDGKYTLIDFSLWLQTLSGESEHV